MIKTFYNQRFRYLHHYYYKHLRWHPLKHLLFRLKKYKKNKKKKKNEIKCLDINKPVSHMVHDALEENKCALKESKKNHLK